MALPQLWAPPPSRFSPPLTALLQREWFSIGGKGRDNAKGEIKGRETKAQGREIGIEVQGNECCGGFEELSI